MKITLAYQPYKKTTPLSYEEFTKLSYPELYKKLYLASGSVKLSGVTTDNMMEVFSKISDLENTMYFSGAEYAVINTKLSSKEVEEILIKYLNKVLDRQRVSGYDYLRNRPNTLPFKIKDISSVEEDMIRVKYATAHHLTVHVIRLFLLLLEEYPELVVKEDYKALREVLVEKGIPEVALYLYVEILDNSNAKSFLQRQTRGEFAPSFSYYKDLSTQHKELISELSSKIKKEFGYEIPVFKHMSMKELLKEG